MSEDIVPYESHAVLPPQRELGPRACHACGSPRDVWLDGLWFPAPSVHHVTQQLPIFSYTRCCGAQDHTEPVATVLAYLRPVEAHARLVCNLVNQHLLQGRPEPAWLTDRWNAWRLRA